MTRYLLLLALLGSASLLTPAAALRAPTDYTSTGTAWQHLANLGAEARLVVAFGPEVAYCTGPRSPYPACRPDRPYNYSAEGLGVGRALAEAAAEAGMEARFLWAEGEPPRLLAVLFEPVPVDRRRPGFWEEPVACPEGGSVGDWLTGVAGTSGWEVEAPPDLAGAPGPATADVAGCEMAAGQALEALAGAYGLGLRLQRPEGPYPGRVELYRWMPRGI